MESENKFIILLYDQSGLHKGDGALWILVIINLDLKKEPMHFAINNLWSKGGKNETAVVSVVVHPSYMKGLIGEIDVLEILKCIRDIEVIHKGWAFYQVFVELSYIRSYAAPSM